MNLDAPWHLQLGLPPVPEIGPPPLCPPLPTARPWRQALADWLQTAHQTLRREYWERPVVRGLGAYEEVLCHLPRTTAWQPTGLLPTIRDLTVRLGKPITVLDLGCGAGLALLTIANGCHRHGIPVQLLGLDRWHFRDGCPPTLPVDPVGLERLIQRFAPAIAPPTGILEPFARPAFQRVDVDRDPWPLAAESLDLVLSVDAFPYMIDKLGVLEALYRSLRPDGIALIDLDESVMPHPSPPYLRRIRLPGLESFSALLADQRRLGVDIHLAPRRHAGNVLLLRKSTEAPLDFGLQVATSEADTIRHGMATHPRGQVTHYAPRP